MWKRRGTASVVGLPTGGVLVAGAAIFVGRPLLVLAIHLATLVGCVTAPSLSLVDDKELLVALAFVALFRLVNLGMPTFFGLTLYTFPVVYLPYLPGAYLAARRGNIQPRLVS